MYSPKEFYLVNNIWCKNKSEIKCETPWIHFFQYWVIDDGTYYEIVPGEKPEVQHKVYGPFNSRQECLEYIELING